MSRRLLILLITLYQRSLSPSTGMLRSLYHGPLFSMLPPGSVGCRRVPHCSAYAVHTLREEKGILTALRKIAVRVFTCHPFTRRSSL